MTEISISGMRIHEGDEEHFQSINVSYSPSWPAMANYPIEILTMSGYGWCSGQSCTVFLTKEDARMFASALLDFLEQ